MAIRIKIPLDKSSLVQSLIFSQDNPQGIFSTYADLIAFAASLGKKYHLRIPLGAIAKEPSPISIEVFHSRGYDSLFKLLAITETNNPQIISNFDEKQEEERIKIFEEYAHGGLVTLEEKLKGAVDYPERILLILSTESHYSPETPATNFDLTRFLN